MSPSLTRLTISGIGFSSDQYLGGNVVYIGPYPCTLVPHQCTTTVITCTTTPGAFGTYPVVVVVDGRSTTKGGFFNYDPAYTSSACMAQVPMTAVLSPTHRNQLLNLVPAALPLGDPLLSTLCRSIPDLPLCGAPRDSRVDLWERSLEPRQDLRIRRGHRQRRHLIMHQPDLIQWLAVHA